MIRQEAIYNKETYQLEDYKEYYNGKLILHTVYDENNNQIFYEDGDNFWFRRKFAKGCKNNTGDIIMFEDSSGLFRYVRWHGKRKIAIKNKFETLRRYDGALVPTEFIEVNVENGGYSLFDLNASRVVGMPHYYANFYKERGGVFTLEYARVRFEEIYYNDASLGDTRRIIHVDEAQRITDYKDLMYEFNIIMCSKNYRPDSRDFRKYIPNYL
jgi:hypothetical protein